MEDRLGDRVRKARERYGMTAAELARRVAISRQQLYMIETNKTPDPGVLKIKAIAEVLRVSVDYLLGGSHTDEEEESAPRCAALAG